MSIDSSLSLKDNSGALVKGFFAAEKVQQASVWINGKKEKNAAEKYHLVEFRSKPDVKTIPTGHALIKALSGKKVLVVNSADDRRQEFSVFNRKTTGTLLLFPLKDFGFLQLFVSEELPGDFYQEDLFLLVDKVQHCMANSIELDLLKKESFFSKEVVQTYKENEEVFSDFIEKANDLIQTVDANGKLIYANNAWLRTLEYEKRELKDLSLIDIIRPDLIPKCFSIFQKLLSGEPIDKMETVFVSKTGKEIVVEGTVNCRYEDGHPTHTRGIFRDVTENKRAEAALKNSEERYRQLVERANDIIYRCDYKGYFKYANPVALRITGYSPEEIMGMHFTDFIREDQREIVREFYKEQFLNKLPDTYLEIPVVTKSGKEIWLGQNVQALMEGEYIVGFQALARDITKTKKIKEELEQAKFLAEESTRAKEQFLANMSHEIRTPINAIMGMTYLLKETTTTDNQRKFLKAIEASSNNLRVIIDDILDISKIGSGKMVFEKGGFRVSEVIETLKNALEIKALEKGIKLGYNIDADLFRVLRGDSVRLNQVLVNLVSNAIKFTDTGSVYVNARVIKETKKKIKVGFDVTDTGIGISKEQLPYIFDSFKQADDTIARRYGGTGLGLAICKSLVEGQGGQISVKSTREKGSTFSFWIAYEKGTDADIKKVRDEEYTTSRRKAQLEGIQVLLVEDNEYNQLFAKNVLVNWGMQVDVAENGQVALEKLRAQKYDLVLMDVQMPLMDGLEATRKLRNELQLQVPVIALTANAIKGDNERCLEAGMDDYISKPFMPEELLTRITGLLGNKGDRPLPGSTVSDNRLSRKKSSEKITDIDSLMLMCGNDPELALQMIDSFQQHIPRSLEELRILVKNEAWVKIGAMIHKLRPSLELVGIQLGRDIRLLEEYGKNNKHPDRIPALSEKFITLAEQAVSELRKEARGLTKLAT